MTPRLRAFSLILLFTAAALAQTAKPASPDEIDPALDKHLGMFLDDYAKDLQTGDAAKLADRFTQDFSAQVSSPALGKDLVRFDRKGYLDDHARRLAAEKRIKVKAKRLATMGRSAHAATVAYEIDLLVDGKPVDGSLCLADLTYDGLNWRLRRLYETRQK